MGCGWLPALLEDGGAASLLPAATELLPPCADGAACEPKAVDDPDGVCSPLACACGVTVVYNVTVVVLEGRSLPPSCPPRPAPPVPWCTLVLDVLACVVIWFADELAAADGFAVVMTGRRDSPPFDDAVIDGQSGSGFGVPAFCAAFVSDVENVNGLGNSVSTDVCVARCIGFASVVDVVGNVNGLGN